VRAYARAVSTNGFRDKPAEDALHEDKHGVIPEDALTIRYEVGCIIT
jgi:hypothetical protein